MDTGCLKTLPLYIWVINIGIFIFFKYIYYIKSILLNKLIPVFPLFKRYDQKQQFLLPLNLEEFVSEGHISRVLNDLFDVVDISAIESTYSANGCPAYHPILLLKILFYGYLIDIRSSRKINYMTQTDTAFMHFATMQKPDFQAVSEVSSILQFG